MKKILALAIALVMALSLTAFAEIELRAAWWGGQERHNNTMAAMDAYAEANGIKIGYEPNSWSSYFETLATQSVGKNLPDILQMSTTDIINYATNGQIVDLYQFVDEGIIDLTYVDPASLSGGTVDGKLAGFTTGTNTVTVIYNKAIFDQAGVEYPADDWTWSDYIATVQEIYEATGIQSDIPFLTEARWVVETWVREAIRGTIPWEQHQVEIVSCAANAPEAMAWLEENKTDLVITDIRMPVIDGLALVEILREKHPEMDFIIISGYADFEYARQAMRYGVRDYLLKPVDTNTLVNAVCKARDEWEMQCDIRALGAQLRPVRNFSPTVSRLLSLLDEEIANEELSLKWISRQKMFLNENYLGKLFQKETGQRFTAYLYEQRMLLAKRLISNDPDILIQEIARRTGYGDNAQYFSIAFKKYTGLSPSEFRKQLL